MLRTLCLVLVCAPLLACSGGDETPAAAGGSTAATAQDDAGPPWETFLDQGAVFVKAGRASGLVMDAAVTLLGAPVAGTDNRRIVGFGNVAEVWDDMVRIEPNRLDASAAGEGMVARRPEKSDLAVVTGLPKP